LKLDVQVKGKTVAKLYEEGGDYRLSYGATATASDFISLTMPVEREPWEWPRDLHPFFRQNLPEGYLLNVVREEFGPYMDGTDISLLAIVGGMGIGRVTVTPEGVLPGPELQPLHLGALLTGTKTSKYFADLVRTYARAAISGAVPKFIAPESTIIDPEFPLGKSTIRTSRHIVKGSDENTPFLGFNEFYSMRVLERIEGVRVAKTKMSEDGRILVVERFDVDEGGRSLYGLEDGCSLLGRPPTEKYAPSMESVLKALRSYIPNSKIQKELKQLGWLVLTNFVVRNADCHSKNIAVYYTSIDDVAFAPAYDIVTTQAYPRFAERTPGLSIEGRKSWAPGKSVEKFFSTRLNIPPREYAAMLESLCDSAVDVGKEVVQAAKSESQWRYVAKQMLHAWNEGIQSLRNPKRSVPVAGLTPVIESVGFSDPEPPGSTREVIGRSELLAASKGKKGTKRTTMIGTSGRAR
jgi:serine/threonine-protein kinase HipA